MMLHACIFAMHSPASSNHSIQGCTASQRSLPRYRGANSASTNLPHESRVSAAAQRSCRLDCSSGSSTAATWGLCAAAPCMQTQAAHRSIAVLQRQLHPQQRIMFILIAADTAQHNTVRQHQPLCRHSHDTAGSTSTSTSSDRCCAWQHHAPARLCCAACRTCSHAVHAGSRCAEVTKVRL